MAQLQESIQRLIDSTAELNTECDRINELIAETDDQLRSAGVALEVWANVPDDVDEVGWAKVGDRWCLTQRVYDVVYGRKGADDEPSDMPKEDRELRPLHSSSRIFRILATSRIPLLVEMLLEDTRQHLEAARNLRQGSYQCPKVARRPLRTTSTSAAAYASHARRATFGH